MYNRRKGLLVVTTVALLAALLLSASARRKNQPQPKAPRAATRDWRAMCPSSGALSHLPKLVRFVRSWPKSTRSIGNSRKRKRSTN